MWCKHTFQSVDSDIYVVCEAFCWLTIYWFICIYYWYWKQQTLGQYDKNAITIKNKCFAMPAFHSFTGNNYTSPFHWTSKLNAHNIKDSPHYQQAFAPFDDSFTFAISLFSNNCGILPKLKNGKNKFYKNFVSGKFFPQGSSSYAIPCFISAWVAKNEILILISA